ncbi:hypothetical protein SapgrDRAFT_0948 [Saprospira grandis DSM 2844]|uniref:Secretion system C-terminal sorting domain-containing protein n=1 Tax=Saprospira grandis DSM 2844 TaxID=694433 RepID=J0P5H0_9BACT|nr:T9SS type A sorting domain-containing protein [Saprospira grandis]EJF52677.1 hypothetical protein SapgrDRAFT_0948 [Saprospira grandis DSM 2844]
MNVKITNYLRRAVFVLAFCLLYGGSAIAQVSIGGIINDYTAVTSLNLPVCDPCDQACAHTITVQDPSAFAAGDKALIIQMKGADIDVTNTSASGDILNINEAGNYEFFEIGSITGNVLTPKYSLIRNYDVTGVVQVVRIPDYGNNVVEVNSTLTAQDWSETNGVGGVLALVTDKLVLNADIDLLGKGYQGIQMTVNGSPDNCTIDPTLQYTLPNTAIEAWEKGSGIVVDDPATNHGRGKRANGGGSGASGDSGGGGGSNYGEGGNGGNRWCNKVDPAGGIGGAALNSYLAQDKVFLGGAGGPGWVSTNNPSSAADGGGIVIVFADTIVGNGYTINVRGTTPVAVNPVGAPDGGGGGGAGGSVVLKTQVYEGLLSVNVSGGDGQNLNTTNEHGPGGGGGGGALLYSLASIPTNLTFISDGGAGGEHTNGARNGSVDGTAGGSVSLYVPIQNPNYTTEIDEDNLLSACDIDDDNDGVLDIVEIYNGDHDGDGTPDYADPNFCADVFAGVNGWDCADGLPDPSGDLDGDGVPNYSDVDFPYCSGISNSVCANFDADGDGSPDHVDLDADNDGIPDIVEAGGVDTDGDGQVDSDLDIDGDGLVDIYDDEIGGASTATYSDECRNTVGPSHTLSFSVNTLDVAVAPSLSFSLSGAYGTDAASFTLELEDGTILGPFNRQNSSNTAYANCGSPAMDMNPISIPTASWNTANDDGVVVIIMNTTTDVDPSLCSGVASCISNMEVSYIGTGTAGNLITGLDSDNDGIPNSLDLDSDNDGIPDLVEIGGEDTDGNGQIDAFTDTDGDGFHDVVDGDVGNDGTAENTANALQLTGADNNNDGLADSYLNGDSDADGILDIYDLDSDNDGIPDAVEAGGTDADGDGRIDNFVDTDGDGFHDAVDGDVGNDGTAENTANALQLTGADNNNDGLADSYPNNDVDGDGIPNQLDLDSDNDGITDLVEAGGTDTNGDGLADNFSDTDNDGLHDVLDGDVGNDGTTENSAQALILTGNDVNNDGAPDNYPNGDADNDGLLNIYDLDSDNDGIADVVEAGGTDTNGDGFADDFVDTDNDGLHDILDGDVGNDGTAENSAQALILTGTDSNNDGQADTYPNGDFDADGLLNIYDLDSDNDGIQDILEAAGTDADGNGRVDTFTDADGDGFADALDGDPNNDGTADNSAAVLILTGADNNNDGTPDSYPNANADADATPNFLDLDSDNDGITDVVEAAAGAVTGAANTDSPSNGTLDGQIEDGPITDANGDGWSDLQNGTINLLDTDADGIADLYDIDADNDGIPDYLEAVCSTCPTFGMTPSGTDANGNGVLDIYEGLDAANQTTGANIGATPNEDNNDGSAPADYLDLDADNDSGYDWAEGFDNGFGTATAGDGNAADEIIQMAAAYVANGGNPAHYPNPDSDGDGLPDWLDNLNGNGYTNNQTPPFLDPNSPFWIDADNDGLADIFDDNVNGSALGTTAPTPNNDGLDDNDWRDANTYVDFPIEWLFFNAERQSSSTVLLSWASETERDNQGFEVERMFDYETDFSQIDFVQGQGNSTTTNYYSYTDNNSYENTTYYRLRQVDFNGDFEYSEVRAVNNTEAESVDISVFPNPASDFVNIRFSQLKTSSKVNFKLLDVLGRQVFSSSQTVRPGDLITLDAIQNLPAGTYYLNVHIEAVQSQLNFEVVKP